MFFPLESQLKNDEAKLFLAVPSEMTGGSGPELQPRRVRLDIWKNELGPAVLT